MSSSRALPFIWKDPLVMVRRANSFSAQRSHWATSSLLQKTGCRPAGEKGSREEKDPDERRREAKGKDRRGDRRMRGLGGGEEGRKERQEGGGGGSKKDIEEVKIKGGGDYRNGSGDKEKREMQETEREDRIKD